MLISLWAGIRSISCSVLGSDSPAPFYTSGVTLGERCSLGYTSKNVGNRTVRDLGPVLNVVRETGDVELEVEARRSWIFRGLLR